MESGVNTLTPLYSSSNSKNTFLSYLKECTKLGGFCTTLIDAYYLITFICIGIGLIWLLTYKRLIYRLQASPKSAWKIK